MYIDIHNPWLLFCIGFGLMLLSTYLMGIEGRKFVTMDPVRRRVSMLALEFPSKNTEITNIMRGLFLLPEDERKSSIRALKNQLLMDYLLFMPGTYGGILVMCLGVAEKMSSVGNALFTTLAWAQVISFVLDAIENAYFWSQIKPNAQYASKGTYKLMQVLEIVKWGIALLGGICGFSALAYFWLSGQYTHDSLRFVGIFFLQIVIFLFASRKKKEQTTSHAG